MASDRIYDLDSPEEKAEFVALVEARKAETTRVAACVDVPDAGARLADDGAVEFGAAAYCAFGRYIDARHKEDDDRG